MVSQPPPQMTVVRPPTNGQAIASLVLGIVGLAVVPLIPSILALVFGYISRGQIDRSSGAQEGRGMAVAGIVLGWVGIGIIVLAAAVFIPVAVYTDALH